MKAHLVDKHDGENCLIQEFCFAEKEKMEVSLAFYFIFIFYSRTFFNSFREAILLTESQGLSSV